MAIFRCLFAALVFICFRLHVYPFVSWENLLASFLIVKLCHSYLCERQSLKNQLSLQMKDVFMHLKLKNYLWSSCIFINKSYRTMKNNSLKLILLSSLVHTEQRTPNARQGIRIQILDYQNWLIGRNETCEGLKPLRSVVVIIVIIIIALLLLMLLPLSTSL